MLLVLVLEVDIEKDLDWKDYDEYDCWIIARTVHTLEDEVWFCCNNCSFLCQLMKIWGLKKNCIHFDGDQNFQMKNSDGGDLQQFPGYAEIFWQPPIWAKKSSRLTLC